MGEVRERIEALGDEHQLAVVKCGPSSRATSSYGRHANS